MKQKYVVTIAGMTFNVLSDDDESFTYEVASTVNSKISNLVLQNTSCTKLKAATLVALDYCAEAKKLTWEKEKLEEKIKKLERELAREKRKAGSDD